MAKQERKGTGQSTHGHAGRGNAGRDVDAASYNVKDWGRTFLSSDGRCVYIDLAHLELCLPEEPSASDHGA